ncbi:MULTISPECIES: phosphoglucosamine mutase [unclassified Ruminococcus]|uniref:phosphoglucosamine mutase n=1 Tax=unclassified Ruminococcus TaxID=2608920 RepID=UPI00210EA1D3|nr:MULTISPECIES: phosphoglucosamine mutase [unclassified Ruminococcus]MCQ4022143.1 phosphoglucosamine mutase [Ruminococcus sp. zg-924]MCQ4114463.1 phosphoglucosamine mutase [Ruminococcus sp. zg-921]
MGRLFGTDGARGVANTELTPELAMNIGRAAAMVLINKETEHPKVLIGKDTRLSSDMLEGALIAGLCSVGANVVKLGVVPTPAVAYLIGKYGADAGIMISASHNPFEFNGIKIFNMDGFKLPDELEEQIESIVLDDDAQPYPKYSHEKLGRVVEADTAADDYISHVVENVAHRLDGLEIALDCSNGSSSRTAEKLFTALGAKCHMLFDNPNGTNINDDCGSTHMDNLMKYVKENNLDGGMAFDGDADRCLAVDENGNLVDGDFIIAICAQDLKSRGKLKNNAVVGTILTNMGFNKFCESQDIKFVSTNVGDRYVLESMRAYGYNLGGEQSGHVIFLDYCTTGDGQMTAAQLLSMMNRRKEKLSDMAKLMSRFPQVMINVKVSNEGKLKFYTDKEIKKEIQQADERLGSRGRILVRASGTEPLIRVMVEGEDSSEITSIANQAAELIRERLV